MAESRICSFETCDKPAAKGRRGLCLAHYKRLWRYGCPSVRKKITNGEAQRFFREVVMTYDGDDCLIWPYARYSSGYGHIAFEGRDRTVSRLVCEKAHGEPPTSQHEAAHLCGKGHFGCVSKRHLAWKTPVENNADKAAHGTVLKGERHGGAKLTEAQVHEIRALKGRLYQREIAERFGVSPHLVGLIHRRERWGWLGDENGKIEPAETPQS